MHEIVSRITELLEPPQAGGSATPWQDAAAEVGRFRDARERARSRQ